MPSVITPKEFFQKEKANLYSEWRRAFWRELLSNSVDAEASEIRIRADWLNKAGEADKISVTFADNGSGMSLETIRDVYMQLGRSTKDIGDGAVGGFGRARILTCFGQERYEIRTRDLLVTGEGGTYEIEHGHPWVDGTILKIDVEDRHPKLLLRALPDTLKQSALLADVRIKLPEQDMDGYDVRPYRDLEMPEPDAEGFRKFRAWTRKGTEFGVLSDEKGTWGTLYVNKGAKALKGRSIIRVNDMSMYDDTIAADVQVTVDLLPSRAKEIMTVSRDAIRAEYRDDFAKLYAKIVADQSSTFRKKGPDPIKRLLSAAGTARKSIRRPQDPAAQAADAGLASIRQMNDDRRPAYEHVRSFAGNPSHEAANPAPAEMRHEVAIFIDKPTPAQLRASKRYMPEVWNEPGGKGAQAELLHAAWTAACGHVLEKLVEIYPSVAGETWSTGFVFDENMAACHTGMEGCRHALLLNPVTSDGKQAFRLSDPDSLHHMVQLAIHEVTHCVHDWHDEHYANLQTRLASQVRERGYTSEIRKELKECLEFQRERHARHEVTLKNAKIETPQTTFDF